MQIYLLFSLGISVLLAALAVHTMAVKANVSQHMGAFSSFAIALLSSFLLAGVMVAAGLIAGPSIHSTINKTDTDTTTQTTLNQVIQADSLATAKADSWQKGRPQVLANLQQLAKNKGAWGWGIFIAIVLVISYLIYGLLGRLMWKTWLINAWRGTWLAAPITALTAVLLVVF